jgi:phosphate:Na+ symporter
MAAIGASSTAKRLALAYILFKLIAAVIALVLFPVTIPLLIRASNTIDGVTLLAGYHTAYNLIGVLVLLPMIQGFTRLVERILPERGSPLTRYLDPAALVTPIATVEAVRRTVAGALETMCGSLATVLAAANLGASVRPRKDVADTYPSPPHLITSARASMLIIPAARLSVGPLRVSRHNLKTPDCQRAFAPSIA